ncbi:GNAT family N-acetyltransferase [Halobacillus salinarum]|uniref:GNAT family N-acetyltransferase n=1 Tax=Halobacillus salinarum TaxID=2932257 RepID=A0ABY4ENL8_9BACI|nr:GNAT family N-acetyltransferase [Halobacillus salinarum]UOQ45254.1 GNAT family N-acetyltransferase [Halobacillus salinarum]
MEVVQYCNPQEFADIIEPLLMEKEAANNLPLGIIDRLVKGTFKQDEVFMYVIKEKGEPVYMTMRTPPHLWILPDVPSLKIEHIEALTHHFWKRSLEVPGVIGEEQGIQWFLDSWKSLTGQEAELQMHQAVYQLDTLLAKPEGNGNLVTAAKEHHSLLTGWLVQFEQETGISLHQEASEVAEQWIEDQRVYLWVVDGEAVSMAARARTTPHGVTVNGVFTPDEKKRNGYATRAVWELTDLLLKKGYQFCALYTDLSNPTSNAIYKKIGYQWIGNSKVYHFV